MRIYFWLAAAALTSSVSFCQSISVGAIGGGMLNNDLNNQFVQNVSSRYTIGPQLDVGLPFGLGFEVDALYRNEGYQVPAFSGLSYQRTSWEFPLLVKGKLPFPLIKPFAEAGYVPRTVQHPFDSGTSHGLLLGGGVEFGIGRLHVSPVLRYTRWNNSTNLLVFPDGPTVSDSQNQVDLLIGLSWKLH